jgi:hypothetical protein
MSTTTTRTARTTRNHRIVRFFGAAALGIATLGTLGATASPASAWVYNGAAGRPGGVTITQVRVADTQGGQLTFFSANGPIVNRTPGTTGAQDVLMTYWVQKYNGAQWVSLTSRQSSVRIPSGYNRARLPNLSVQPLLNNHGYYRVIEFFQWNAPGTGTPIGFSFVNPSRVTDHACVTQSRLCAAYAGFVQVGRPYIFGGGW